MGAMARSLADQLNEMTDQDTPQLGQQIFKAQRALAGLMDTAKAHRRQRSRHSSPDGQWLYERPYIQGQCAGASTKHYVCNW